MQPIILFIAIIIFFIIALTITNYIQHKKGNTTERELPPPTIDLSDNGCCGAHEVCERDSLIATFVEEPEYFDDDELDKYSNRDSSKFNEDEVEEFREVFYTILDEEKPRWVRSLQMRYIPVPDLMKDEVLMFVNELRMQNTQA